MNVPLYWQCIISSPMPMRRCAMLVHEHDGARMRAREVHVGVWRPESCLARVKQRRDVDPHVSATNQRRHQCAALGLS